MKSDLNNKTVLELKEICKKKELKGYSKLCKDDLVKMLSKKLKKGGNMNGGNEDILACDTPIEKCSTYFSPYDYNQLNELAKIIVNIIVDIDRLDGIWLKEEKILNSYINRSIAKKYQNVNVKEICSKNKSYFSSSKYKNCKTNESLKIEEEKKKMFEELKIKDKDKFNKLKNSYGYLIYRQKQNLTNIMNQLNKTEFVKSQFYDLIKEAYNNSLFKLILLETEDEAKLLVDEYCLPGNAKYAEYNQKIFDGYMYEKYGNYNNNYNN